jgi:hypothetical protein
MKIMEFNIKISELEMTINLRNTELIKEYLKNPQKFEAYAKSYANCLVGDFYAPEEIKELLNKIDIECIHKKLSLTKNYKNSPSN